METPSISLDGVWCARQRTPWPLQHCRVNEWSKSLLQSDWRDYACQTMP